MPRYYREVMGAQVVPFTYTDIYGCGTRVGWSSEDRLDQNLSPLHSLPFSLCTVAQLALGWT